MKENRAIMTKTESSDVGPGSNMVLEQNLAGSTEKYPNLTLLEYGQNPGEILRAAREKAGYSRSDISAQTKINERQLEAIESGDVSRLPPETFAKAFIKSYCKALKIDPLPILLSFGFPEPGISTTTGRLGHQAEAARTEPFEPKMPDSSKRLSSLNFDRKPGKKSFSYVIVLAAMIVMALFYIPVFLSSNQSDETAQLEPVQPESLAQGQPESGLETGSAFKPLESTGSASEPLPLTLQVPEETQNLQNPSSVATVPPAQRELIYPDDVAKQSLPSSPSPKQASASSALDVAGATSSALPVAGRAGVLKFNFQEQSWLTVRDANDAVLVSQLNDSGSNLEVRGQAPFKLIVGNAKAVSVSNNGKAVDLSSSIKGEVARVTVQ